MHKTSAPKDQRPSTKPPLKERAFVWLQYPLPHHLLSWGMHHLARSEWPPLKRLMIEQAVARFGIDMRQADPPDHAAYPSFNAFFTRALKPEARPLAEQPEAIACPCDGTVTQAGRIRDGRMLQAKGLDYSLLELLGGDPEWTRIFDHGEFVNIYLSPRDYHRVHMPQAGVLHRTVHVPGRLFSVNAMTNRGVPRLFTRNERIACLFETDAGPMAVILVGAIFVASMETQWGGLLDPPKGVEVSDFGPPALSVKLERGQEMGRFNMGSTVLVLFAPHHARWSSKLKPGVRVKMGQRIGVTAKPGEP